MIDVCVIKGGAMRDYLQQIIDHFTRLSSDDQYSRFYHLMTPTSIRDWLLSIETPDTFFIIAFSGEQIVGVCQISSGKNNAEIGLSVNKEFRGKGIAKTIVLRAIEEAWAAGIQELCFMCKVNNHPCRELFSSLGFTVTFEEGELYGSLCKK